MTFSKAKWCTVPYISIRFGQLKEISRGFLLLWERSLPVLMEVKVGNTCTVSLKPAWWWLIEMAYSAQKSCRASQVVSVVKNLFANAGDLGLTPGLGRSPGGGHDSLLQYSCLENPIIRGAWRATVHRKAKSQTWLMQLSTHRAQRSHEIISPRGLGYNWGKLGEGLW